MTKMIPTFLVLVSISAFANGTTLDESKNDFKSVKKIEGQTLKSNFDVQGAFLENGAQTGKQLCHVKTNSDSGLRLERGTEYKVNKVSSYSGRLSSVDYIAYAQASKRKLDMNRHWNPGKYAGLTLELTEVENPLKSAEVECFETGNRNAKKATKSYVNQLFSK